MNSPLSIRVGVLPVERLDASVLEMLESLLDEEERVRSRRFRFESHRREFVAAHGLKRTILSAEVPSVPPSAWRFQTTAAGKPEVVQIPELNFSLTHCDGLVACATGWDVAIGLDAEAVHRDVPLELIAHHFSPAERVWLESRPSDQLAKAFFGLWTLKESWVKATGLGLSQSLTLASFKIGDPPRVTFEPHAGEDVARWHFRRWCLNTHVVALGWRGALRKVRCNVIDPRTLAPPSPAAPTDCVIAWPSAIESA